MRVRWRGLRWLASGVWLMCVVALSACASGSGSAPATGTTATTGPVTVTTDLKAYGVSDAIGVTVSNTSASDYFSVTGKSACVIIQLERFDAAKGSWTSVDPCDSHAAGQVLVIAKNSQQPFTLAPQSASDPNAWAPGLYRVTLTYSAKSDGVTSVQRASCAAFNVQ